MRDYGTSKNKKTKRSSSLDKKRMHVLLLKCGKVIAEPKELITIMKK